MDTEKKVFSIVGGPDKDRLFDVSKYTNDETAEISTGFTVLSELTTEDTYGFDVHVTKITMIEHKGSSGTRFSLHGYCEANLRQLYPTTLQTTYEFVAFYDAVKHEGAIQLL